MIFLLHLKNHDVLCKKFIVPFKISLKFQCNDEIIFAQHFNFKHKCYII